jgi:hypothetical protein
MGSLNLNAVGEDYLKRARLLVIVASIILFGTALFHASGYLGIARALEASSVKPFIGSAFKGLWLMFSAHLIVLGLVVLAASRSASGKRVILLCALIPVVDTALLLTFVGVFVGTALLAIAALLLLTGGLLLPHVEESALRRREKL